MLKPFAGGRENRPGWRTTIPALLIILAAVLLFHRYALSYHFWPDDWQLVGPIAAAEFLADPSILVRTFQVFGHYAPLQKAWYVAQSLLFQDHPLPYHLLNLALAVLAGFALFRLLLKYGLLHAGALCGALYFVIATCNMFVISYITGSNYLWLSLFLILALSRWEDLLITSERRHLLAAALLTLAAQYVQSIGVVIPLILGARALLASPRNGGLKTGRAVGLALLLTLAAGFLQLLPRLLLPAGASPLEPNFSIPRLLQTIGMSLSRQLREAAWMAPLGPLVLALFLLILAVWAVKRENWRVMALGILLAVLSLIPPVIMINYTPDDFSLKMRYMTLPNLGLSFVLGALVSAVFTVKRPKRLSWAFIFLAAAVMTVLFVQTKVGSSELHELFTFQDGYVWKCADGYRRSFLSIGREADCRTIVIIDVPLKQTVPRGITGNLLIQETNHEVFHRFFRLSEQTGLSVKFIPFTTHPVASPGDCVFIAEAGKLKRY